MKRSVVLSFLACIFSVHLNAQDRLVEKYIGFNYGYFYNTHQTLGIATMAGRIDFYREFAEISRQEVVYSNSFTNTYSLEGGIRIHRLNKGFLDINLGIGEFFAGFSAQQGQGDERIETNSRIKFFNIPMGLHWGWEFNRFHLKAGMNLAMLISPKSDAETLVWAPNGTDGHDKVMDGELFFQDTFIEDFVTPLIFSPQWGIAAGYNFEDFRIMANFRYQRSFYMFRSGMHTLFGDRYNYQNRISGYLMEFSIQWRFFSN